MQKLLSHLQHLLATFWHVIPEWDDIHHHVVNKETLRRAIQDAEDVEIYGVPGHREAVYKAAMKLLNNGIGDVNATRIRRLLGFKWEYHQWMKER